MARVALQSNDVELVAVNDPFITTDYMVCCKNLFVPSSSSAILFVFEYLLIASYFVRFAILSLKMDFQTNERNISDIFTRLSVLILSLAIGGVFHDRASAVPCPYSYGQVLYFCLFFSPPEI